MSASAGEPGLGRRLSVVAHASRMPPDTRLPSLSVVLPCHDEEQNVAEAIRQAAAAAAAAADRFEVLVVDDGSTDATRAIAATASSRDARVRVLAHDTNRGYGAALRTGIAAARCDWILLTDADLQFDLTELDQFVGPARTHDVVVGYRLVRMDPLLRRVNAYAWNRLVGRVFDLDVRDVDCAFKLIRTDLALRLRLTADGAMISTELMARARLAGASVVELGVRHRPRVAGEQSGADPAVVLGAFRELHRIRAELDARPGRAPSPTEPPHPAAA
jgi:glycosyltransferase involved in cell wall biosynthesis